MKGFPSMTNKTKKSIKKDLLLIVVILAISAAGFAVNYFINQKPAIYLEVSIDGQIIQTLPLNQDTDLTIKCVDGGFNHLVIRNGTAWVDDASCPDKICIHNGKIQLTGQMIVCLPNRVIIKVADKSYRS